MSEQTYRGNGKHEWEEVTSEDSTGVTDRLRVPGGWLYRVRSTIVDQGTYDETDHVNTVFVAMPEVVKHKV